jgi:hypothetical protein
MNSLMNPSARARGGRLSIASAALALAISGAAVGQPDRSREGEPPPPTGQTVSPLQTHAPVDLSLTDELDHPDWSLAQREDRASTILANAVAHGSLGHTEYARAHDELVSIQATEDRWRKANHGELTDTQTFRLESRLNSLAASIHWKR